MRQLNELFLDWLTEWYREAQNQNLKSRFAFKKAIDSIQAHTVPILSAKDAGKLAGIGEKLVQKLHNKLLQTGDSAPFNDVVSSQTIDLDSPDSFSDISASQPLNNSPVKPKLKRKRSNARYVPKYRSGAYAILCALLQNDGKPATKDEIISKGQIYCDSSFLLSQSSFHYSAWSSIKSLLERELVYKHGNPALFELSEEGKDLARKLSPNSTQSQVDSGANATSAVQSTENPINDSVQSMEVGSFDICCLVDARERPDQSNRDAFLHHFQGKGLSVTAETLEVGDFLWIAKSKEQYSGAKVVLDVIVERKRHDDFVSSLLSNRLHEQRHRLSRCGIRRVIYLLEAHRNQPVFEEFGIERINSAIFELQHEFNFMVKCTKNSEESCAFLQSIHEFLLEKYSQQPIQYCCSSGREIQSGSSILYPFSHFQSLNSKSINLTVRDIFTRQLLCLNGMTASKAQLITAKYPTIQLFRRALLDCKSEKERENFVSLMTENKIKLKLSKSLYKLFKNGESHK